MQKYAVADVYHHCEIQPWVITLFMNDMPCVSSVLLLNISFRRFAFPPSLPAACAFKPVEESFTGVYQSLSNSVLSLRVLRDSHVFPVCHLILLTFGLDPMRNWKNYLKPVIRSLTGAQQSYSCNLSRRKLRLFVSISPSR